MPPPPEEGPYSYAYKLQVLPPIYRKVSRLLRKKKVDHYIPNTFRVFGEEVEKATFDKVVSWQNRDRPAPMHYIDDPNSTLPYVHREHVHNRPHGGRSCQFISTNVESLNEPICHVHTDCSRHLQPEWWPPSEDCDRTRNTAEEASFDDEKLRLSSGDPGRQQQRYHREITSMTYPPPSMTKIDYSQQLPFRSTPKGHSRFSANPKFAARGIVPVNDLWHSKLADRSNVWREGISIEGFTTSNVEPKNRHLKPSVSFSKNAVSASAQTNDTPFLTFLNKGAAAAASNNHSSSIDVDRDYIQKSKHQPPRPRDADPDTRDEILPSTSIGRESQSPVLANEAAIAYKKDLETTTSDIIYADAEPTRSTSTAEKRLEKTSPSVTYCSFLP